MPMRGLGPRGFLTEEGTHEELLKNSMIYKELYETQFKGVSNK